MITDPTLTGGLVTLRGPRERDKADRLACPRSAEANRMYGGSQSSLGPVTGAEVDRWYEYHAKEPLHWMIEAEGRCVGSARLMRVSEEARHARYAIGLFDASVWNRGYGTEATRLVLRCAFEQIGIHRIDLVVLEYNHRAIACYKKSGFVQEGVLRESAFVDGVWYSDILMGILEHEYRAVSPQAHR